jgi:transposase
VLIKMRTKKWKVNLSTSERKKLKDIANRGTHPAKIIRRANILLALDETQGKVATQEEIAKRFCTTTTLIHTISKQFVEQGLEAAITRKKRETPPVASIATGDIEAKIIQIACSPAPEGKSWWTLVMIEKEMGKMGITISDNTVGRVLKKHHLNHTRANIGASHPSKMQSS